MGRRRWLWSGGEVKVEIGCEMAILGAKLDTGRVGVKVVCRRNSAGG